MIYCDLIENYGASALYKFGYDVDNMTGQIIFYSNDIPKVINFPENEAHIMSPIGKIYARKKADFEKSIFKDKISYECG